MTSAKSAVEAAAFTMLSQAVTLAPVFQDVPDDTQPPVVIVGDIEAELLTDTGDPDRRVSLSILTVTAGDERKPLLDIQEQIESISPGTAQFDGWTLHFLFTDDDAVLAGDASGYVGTSRFTVLTLRD